MAYLMAGEETGHLEAQALLGCVADLHAAGVPVTGELLHSYGTRTDVAPQILHRAADLHAGAIVLGADTRHTSLTAAVTAHIAAHAPTHVIVINRNAGALGHPTAATANSRDTPTRSSAIPHSSSVPPKS